MPADNSQMERHLWGAVAWAHTRNDLGKRHDLVDHLRAVAALASQFAAPFEASELAHYLGLWHDLGKFSPDFFRWLFKYIVNVLAVHGCGSRQLLDYLLPKP